MKIFDPFAKQVFKVSVALAAFIFVCKFTGGAVAAILVALGLWCGLQGRIGLCICSYVLCPLLVIFNPKLLPKTALLSTCLRMGPVLITLALMVAAERRRGREKLPFGMMYVYLIFALVSSLSGYCFQVSVLKIIGFAIFVAGIAIGTSNLNKRPKDLEIIRVFFYAMAAIVGFGGLCTLASPAIAYPLNAAWTLRAGGTMEEAAEVIRNFQGVTLFAGITQHSQALAPLTVAAFGYVLCDTLFVVRKITPLSMALLIVLPIELFMTRSRTGLLSLFTALLMTFMFTKGRLLMSPRLQKKVSQLTMLLIALFIACGVVGEIKSGMISRWIFKTDDVAADLAKRSAAESVMSSRSGLIEEAMEDFAVNPLLGIGFQVNRYSPMHVKDKLLVLSAPVEKGILPLVVLSEGGIIGALVFIGFLAVFYSACVKKHYVVTATLFTVLLATNMGEATFFSPGGPGGIIWMYCVVGGFCADMMIKHRRTEELVMQAYGGVDYRR